MLAVISPAKNLDTTSRPTTRKHSQPRLLDQALELVDVMRTKAPDEVADLMHLSDELAELNAQRYRDIEAPFTTRNAHRAALMFNGDTYQGMDARNRFDERDWTEATKTLRILSGLYGLLRPLDLVQPYRLEMGTQLSTEKGRNLYQYWGSTITDLLRDDLAASPGVPVLINLASTEYFDAVDTNALGARVISPRFEDRTPKGEWKVVSFSAKRARGEMAAWLVQHRARTAAAIKDFDAAGYSYAADVSTPDTPVFRREK